MSSDLGDVGLASVLIPALPDRDPCLVPEWHVHLPALGRPGDGDILSIFAAFQIEQMNYRLFSPKPRELAGDASDDALLSFDPALVQRHRRDREKAVSRWFHAVGYER